MPTASWILCSTFMIWTRDRIVGNTRLLLRESSRKTLPETGSSMVLRTRSAATSVKKSTPRNTLTLRLPDAVLTDAYEMNWSTVSLLKTPESPKTLKFAEPPASTCRHDTHVLQNSPGPWSPRQLPALATAAAKASLALSSLPTRRYACASLLETRAASRHRVAGQLPIASPIRCAGTDYVPPSPILALSRSSPPACPCLLRAADQKYTRHSPPVQ